MWIKKLIPGVSVLLNWKINYPSINMAELHPLWRLVLDHIIGWLKEFEKTLMVNYLFRFSQRKSHHMLETTSKYLKKALVVRNLSDCDLIENSYSCGWAERLLKTIVTYYTLFYNDNYQCIFYFCGMLKRGEKSVTTALKNLYLCCIT